MKRSVRSNFKSEISKNEEKGKKISLQRILLSKHLCSQEIERRRALLKQRARQQREEEVNFA